MRTNSKPGSCGKLAVLLMIQKNWSTEFLNWAISRWPILWYLVWTCFAFRSICRGGDNCVVVKERHERIPFTRMIVMICRHSPCRDLLAAVGLGRQAGIENCSSGLTSFLKVNSQWSSAWFSGKQNADCIVVDEYGGVSGLVTWRIILGHLFEEAYSGDNEAFEIVKKSTTTQLLSP